MRRILKVLSIFVLLAICGGGLTLWWAAKAAQEVPEFYRAAVERPVTNVAENTEELKVRVEELSADVGKIGRWEATFTADQINAWLMSDLVTQFPHVLPKGTQDPRVFLESGKVMVAARYRDKRFDSVISFELGLRLTDEPNVVAIKINRLRAGALPIPISHFSSKISKAAAKGTINIRWEEEDGVPIALVEIPQEHDRYIEQPVIIEQIDVRAGEVFLSGQTGDDAKNAWKPTGALFRLASTSTMEPSQ